MPFQKLVGLDDCRHLINSYPTNPSNLSPHEIANSRGHLHLSRNLQQQKRLIVIEISLIYKSPWNWSNGRTRFRDEIVWRTFKGWRSKNTTTMDSIAIARPSRFFFAFATQPQVTHSEPRETPSQTPHTLRKLLASQPLAHPQQCIGSCDDPQMVPSPIIAIEAQQRLSDGGGATKVHVILRRYIALTWMCNNRELV